MPVLQRKHQTLITTVEAVADWILGKCVKARKVSGYTLCHALCNHRPRCATQTAIPYALVQPRWEFLLERIYLLVSFSSSRLISDKPTLFVLMDYVLELNCFILVLVA